MSSIFDTDILSEDNNKQNLIGLQGLDKENPLEYILADNSLQLNKQFKIKYISEYNTENGGIIYSNNKQIYRTLLCIIGKYTDNAWWPRSYKELEKEINEFWFQLPTFNKEDYYKNYIMPLETLFSDKTCPLSIHTYINNLKIRNKNKYIAYFLYNAAICIILNVETTCTNFYIFYTGLPLIAHSISKTNIDIKQFIKSVNINLKLISYTAYDNKLKPPYYQQYALIPYNNDKK